VNTSTATPSHPLASLVGPSDAATAQASEAPPGTAASVAANAFLADFADTIADGHKVATLYSFRELTVAEFKQALAEAQKKASTVDTAAGFKPADGAKGQDAYGPKRRTMNNVATAMRKVWGVLRLNPETILPLQNLPQGAILGADLFPSFNDAIAKATEWLDSTNESTNKVPLDWTGATVEQVEAARNIKKARRMDAKAEDMAMDAEPMKPGETQADYMARLESAKDDARIALETESMQATADRIIKKLKEKHGDKWVDVAALIWDQAC
jgi:hypothetical protein